MAYPQAVAIVKACVDTAMQLGLPEAQLPLAQAAILLATAPKSNSGCMAIDAAIAALGVTNMSGMGKVIQSVMGDYKGRVDGKAVSAAVKARLS